jgi:hypothetical protein
VTHQRADVLLALAQRRHADGDDIQPVIEVSAKPAVRDLFLEVAIRRHDDARIHAERASATHAVELLVLQHLKELRLKARVHVADLVEEDGPLVGQLELAGLLGVSSRERSLLVPEELALEELAWERSAVDLHERSLGSQAAFARILNVSPRTVQAWETNARRPSDAALKLLSVAKKNPEVLLD